MRLRGIFYWGFWVEYLIEIIGNCISVSRLVFYKRGANESRLQANVDSPFLERTYDAGNNSV